MKEIFKIAEFDRNGNLRLKVYEFDTYEEALSVLKSLPTGTYQIQKVFIIE